MADTRVVSFKIYLFTNDADEPEIRRFGLEPSAVSNYSFLTKRIMEVFPKLSDKAFTISWRDEEGDEVAVSSDNELIIAIESMAADIKRFYIRVNSPVGGSGEKDNILHPGVHCDGCERGITGYRYKCLICLDYDLCSACEQDGIHPEHLMLRISDPCLLDRVKIHKVAHFVRTYIPEMRHHTGEHIACKKRRRHEKRRSCPMTEVNPDSPHFKYLEWGLGALQKLLDPLGATVEIQVPKKPEETAKEEKKEEKQEKQKPAPTPSPPSQQEARFPVAQEISDTMKQKIEEITKILASQAMSNGAEDDGWVAFEELKKGTEEKSPSTSQSPPKEPQAQPSAPQAENTPETSSQANLYPSLHQQELPSDPRVREALQKMLSMGFTNEGGWLTSLLSAKGGSIEQALEVLAPVKK